MKPKYKVYVVGEYCVVREHDVYDKDDAQLRRLYPTIDLAICAARESARSEFEKDGVSYVEIRRLEDGNLWLEESFGPKIEKYWKGESLEQNGS